MKGLSPVGRVAWKAVDSGVGYVWPVIWGGARLFSGATVQGCRALIYAMAAPEIIITAGDWAEIDCGEYPFVMR